MNYLWWVQICRLLCFEEASNKEKATYEKTKVGQVRGK